MNELSKLFLKIMLWSLGFAAITGVGAVLLSAGSMVGRVVGTGFLTAAAAGLMIPMSAMIDRVKTRAAGLLGTGIVVGEFCAAMALIWNVDRVLFSISIEGRVGLTMVFVALTAGAAMLFLVLISTTRTAWTSRVGLILSGVVLVVLMMAIWLPGRAFVRREWGETAGALSIYGALAVVCLIGVGRGFHWRWAGLGACAVACAMLLGRIWIGPGGDLSFSVFVSLNCLVAVTSYAVLILLCPVSPAQRWVLWGTIASVILTAGLIDLLVINYRIHYMTRQGVDLLDRFAGAGGILSACGTLALLVLARLSRRTDVEHASLDLLEISLVCPRCALKQTLPIGPVQCRGCQLRIHIRVEEPRCPNCEYLLYRLTSNRCPECGTLVGHEKSDEDVPVPQPGSSPH